MKNLKSLIGIAIILSASACTSTYQAGSTAQDDVYYSSKNNPAPAQQTYPATPAAPANDYSSNNSNYNQDNQSNQNSDPNQGSNQNSNDGYNSSNEYSAPSDQYSNSTQSTDGQGNTYITNNYYDDYYDYEYSSRIRRYYTPAVGYGYYDPFYTNSYWYDYSPNSWGVSIYLGYNWWAPTYYYSQPFCYGGGFGYGYSSYYGYNPYWYSGWYGGGYGGYHHGYNHGYNNGYYHGYNDGYWNGYYAGNTNPYYYNSYDDNSHYYGPRGSVGGNTPRGGSGRAVGSIGQKFETAVAQGKIPRTGTTDPDVRGTSLDRPGKTIQPRGDSNNPQIGKGDNATSNPSRDNIPAQTRPSKSGDQNTDDRGGLSKPGNNGDVKNDRGLPAKTNTGETPTNTDSKNQNVRPGTQPTTPRNNNNGDIRNTTPPRQNNQQTTPRQNNQENQQTTPRQNNVQPTNPRQNNIQQNQNQNQNYNSRPETNPRQNNIQNNNQNGDSRNNNNINSRPDYAQPKNNTEQNRDNSRNNYTPSQEPVREQNYKQPQKEINPAPRNESRTPIFQPRNEPKQYKQEKSSDYQRSAPSNPAPSTPAPSRGNNNNNNSGGSKRR